MTLGSCPAMFLENVVKAPTTHGFALGVEKELRGFSVVADGKPSSYCGRCFFPERQRTFLATLATDTDAHNRAERNVLHSESDELRNTQPRCVGDVEHGSVADSALGGWIGSVQNGLHFIDGKMLHEARFGSLFWDGQDLQYLLHGGWDPKLNKAHEGFDRGEPYISGARTVRPFGFEV